jgi:hypothetical protein
MHPEPDVASHAGKCNPLFAATAPAYLRAYMLSGISGAPTLLLGDKAESDAILEFHRRACGC